MEIDMTTSLAITGNAPIQAGVPPAVEAAGYTGGPGTTLTAAATPEQVPSSATGVAAGGTTLIVVLLIGFFLWRAVDKKKAKPSHIALAFTAGVLLSGSMIGVMAQQTAGSVGTGLATMFSTVTTNSGGR
jgi:hypothetical protein